MRRNGMANDDPRAKTAGSGSQQLNQIKNGSKVQSGSTGKNLKENEVWVRKWVDYSSKYGLGYYLSNDATGVFFNDSTKIVLDPNNYHFDYVERRTLDRQDFGYQYTLDQYPKELQKKVTLLQHFRSYLEGSEKPKAEK